MGPAMMAALPSLIGAGGGIASSFINRPGKAEGQQRLRSMFGGGILEKLLFQMLMAKMARSSMFQPSLLTGKGRTILGSQGFKNNQMGTPYKCLITGGQ